MTADVIPIDRGTNVLALLTGWRAPWSPPFSVGGRGLHSRDGCHFVTEPRGWVVDVYDCRTRRKVGSHPLPPELRPSAYASDEEAFAVEVREDRVWVALQALGLLRVWDHEANAFVPWSKDWQLRRSARAVAEHPPWQPAAHHKLTRGERRELREMERDNGPRRGPNLRRPARPRRRRCEHVGQLGLFLEGRP